MSARTGERTGTGTHWRPDAVQAIRIAGSLAAGLAVILLISRLLSPQGPGQEDSLPQVVPGDSLADSMSVPMVMPEFDREELPGLWLQARSDQSGNAGWGPDVGMPFDSVWVLTSTGGREFFSSPALVDSSLYIGCNDGKIRAIHAGTGIVSWTFSTDCGICGEVAVDSTRVYFGGQDGTVYALDRVTGARLWSSGLGYHVFCDVGILEDTLIVTGNSMGKVCALHAGTGEPVWSGELGGLVLGPAIVDSLCVFTTENGKVAVYDASGIPLWTNDYSGQASAPSADPTGIFVGFSGGVLRKFDIMDGSIIWERDLTESVERTVLSRPVLKDSLVLAGGTDSRLYCLDARTGEPVWETEFDNWLQVPPAVGDTCIYVCCDDQWLHLVDLGNGASIDSLDMGSYAGTAPLLAGGRLFYGTASGALVCLEGTRRLLVEPPLASGTAGSVDPDIPAPGAGEAGETDGQDEGPEEGPPVPERDPVVVPDEGDTVMPLDPAVTGHEGSG